MQKEQQRFLSQHCCAFLCLWHIPIYCVRMSWRTPNWTEGKFQEEENTPGEMHGIFGHGRGGHQWAWGSFEQVWPLPRCSCQQSRRSTFLANGSQLPHQPVHAVLWSQHRYEAPPVSSSSCMTSQPLLAPHHRWHLSSGRRRHSENTDKWWAQQNGNPLWSNQFVKGSQGFERTRQSRSFRNNLHKKRFLINLTSKEARLPESLKGKTNPLWKSRWGFTNHNPGT